MKSYIEQKLFKLAAYIMFKGIIKFHKKWKRKDDDMKGMYALDIGEKTYLMKYELAALEPAPIHLLEES